MRTDVERLSDNDLVHVHSDLRSYVDDGDVNFPFAHVLVADDPTSLVTATRGVISVPTRNLYRAGLALDGPVCFECRRRFRERFIGE